MHFAATAIAAATLLPIVAIDLAKSVFQLYFIGADGKPVNRRITRAKLLDFFANRAHSLVAMETCGGAHCFLLALLETVFCKGFQGYRVGVLGWYFKGALARRSGSSRAFARTPFVRLKWLAAHQHCPGSACEFVCHRCNGDIAWAPLREFHLPATTLGAACEH